MKVSILVLISNDVKRNFEYSILRLFSDAETTSFYPNKLKTYSINGDGWILFIQKNGVFFCLVINDFFNFLCAILI